MEHNLQYYSIYFKLLENHYGKTSIPLMTIKNLSRTFNFTNFGRRWRECLECLFPNILVKETLDFIRYQFDVQNKLKPICMMLIPKLIPKRVLLQGRYCTQISKCSFFRRNIGPFAVILARKEFYFGACDVKVTRYFSCRCNKKNKKKVKMVVNL